MHAGATIERRKAMPSRAQEAHAGSFTTQSEPGGEVGRGQRPLLFEQGQRGVAFRLHVQHLCPLVARSCTRVQIRGRICKALRLWTVVNGVVDTRFAEFPVGGRVIGPAEAARFPSVTGVLGHAAAACFVLPFTTRFPRPFSTPWTGAWTEAG